MMHKTVLFLLQWCKVHPLPLMRTCQISCSELVQRVNKIGPQLPKLLLSIIAFRICKKCYRQKSTVWPGKFIHSKNNNPKKSLFSRTRIWVSLLWVELYAKLLAPGQLLGYHWKLWGITVQTSFVEGYMRSDNLQLPYVQPPTSSYNL